MFKKNFRRILVLMFILFMSLGFCSCNSIINDDHSGVMGENYVDRASPLPSESMSETQMVNLYYGYRGLSNLIVNQSEIKFAYNESNAVTVLNSLIDGPDYADRHISRLINSDTTVINVYENDNYLFVTLSSDFLEMPAGFDDSVISENERRYLAVATIINTMVDFGGYYRVQILIDRTGNGVGTPITNSECGFTGNDYYEPHGYYYSLVLDAQNTIKTVFDLIESNNWHYVYDFLIINDSDNNQIAHNDSFVDTMNALNLSVSEFSYIGETEIIDSSFCSVFISYSYTVKDSENISKTNLPIKMVKVNNIWKVDYEDFLSLWNNG